MPASRSLRTPGLFLTSHEVRISTGTKNKIRNAHPAGHASVPAEPNRISAKTTHRPPNWMTSDFILTDFIFHPFESFDPNRFPSGLSPTSPYMLKAPTFVLLISG